MNAPRKAPSSLRTTRPTTRLIRRSRYLILLVLVLAAYGVYLLVNERRGASDPSAQTCTALPPELSSELSDPADCRLLHRNLTEALATSEGGAIMRWINTKSGNSGTVKLGATEMRGGNACRKVEVTIARAAGATRRAEITACLKDGKWTVQA